mgnify:CR=1 FL=1
MPHDFVIEGNFSKQADLSHGYLPYGVGLYRKHLLLPRAQREWLRKGTHIAWLQFDGVQARAQVYLDGDLLGTHASGYTPFGFELPAAALARLSTAPVLLAVRADATRPDGWWYDGGGIYRHVQLVLRPLQHIAQDGGVYLPTTVTGRIDRVSQTADAQLEPSITVVNAGSNAAKVRVSVVLRDSAGVFIGTTAAVVVLPANANATVSPPPIKVP